MEITLQELLDELARDGGDLAALLRRYTDEGNLSAEQIAALRDEATTAFRTIQTGNSLTEADVAQLETLADAITGLTAEDTHLTQAAEAIATRAAEIAQRAGVTDTAAEPEGEGEGEGAEGNGDAPVDGEGEAAPETPEATAPPADAPADQAGAQPEAVAASAGRGRRRVDLAAVARRTTRPQPTQDSSDLPFGGSLVASVEANGVRPGHMFGSWTEAGGVLARTIQSASPSALMASAVAAGRAKREFYDRSGLLQLRREYPADLVVNDANADSTALLARAVDTSRLPGGADSLVAAAGWCAPSETLYELCELPCSLAGILSLPEIGAPRGGVRYTKGLDFCDIYEAAGYFHYTEAELEATPAPTKPCMEIPCVDFDECRLEVDGMCIVGDIPQARAYPEIVSQFLQGATCARAHRTNALKIGRIAAGSQNDGVVSFAPMGATASVLNAIDLKIMEYRYRGLREQDGNAALLEMVLPFWLRGVIRGDIANRNGYANPFDVSNAQIDAWFRSRGVVVRWVYDWQPLPAVCATPPAAPITAWPTTVEIIIYEAGTWVLATQDVISLENLYDSTLIRQNKYTALFVEDAFCLINRCNGSIRFQVPICPSGNTGAQPEFACVAGFAAPLVAAELAGMVTGPALPDGAQSLTPAELEALKQD